MSPLLNGSSRAEAAFKVSMFSGSNQNFFLERNNLPGAHLCVQKPLMRRIKQRRLVGGGEKPGMSWRKSGQTFLSLRNLLGTNEVSAGDASGYSVTDLLT